MWWVSPHTKATFPFPPTTSVVPCDSTSHLTLCLSPLLHPSFSTVPPFRHQAISALFPTQQICSLEPFPEYFGMYPCPLPICCLAWHRSRGQQGGRESGGGYTRIVTVQSWCNKSWMKKKRKEGEKGGRREGKKGLTSCPFLCYMALMFGHG